VEVDEAGRRRVGDGDGGGLGVVGVVGQNCQGRGGNCGAREDGRNVSQTVAEGGLNEGIARGRVGRRAVGLPTREDERDPWD
jgi:hypothetical protein